MEKILIGNWKSNKTIDETREFLTEFSQYLLDHPPSNKKIIICPTFTTLKYTADFLHANNIEVAIGAQNISRYEEGAYTGEVAARQLQNIAQWVIIGHSERRRLFGETEDIITEKLKQAKKYDLKTVLCVQDESEDTSEAEYVAYEPPTSIGTGSPDDPKHIEEVFGKILEKNSSAKLLYGGSIDEKNIEKYREIKNISGFLIGGASLNASSFAGLISKC